MLLADEVSPWVPVAVLLALPAAVVVIYGLRRHFARRKLITDIQLVVQDLMHGRTERRADPTARGQLGQVARNVNQLAALTETALVEAEQNRRNLQAILAEADEIVVVTDEDDRIQLLNPAAERLLGRAGGEALGRPLAELFPQPELLALHQAAYSSSRPVTRHLRLPATRRTLDCLITASTMYAGPHFRGTLLVLRDLTDVQQSLQMKTDFVTNASHELRTPLATIMAAVETMGDALPATAAQANDTDLTLARRCTEIILTQASRLQLMVQDLLDLARTEDPRAVVRAEPVDLNHVCDLVVPLLAPAAAQKKLALRVDLAPDAGALRADERLLVLVLKNLVDNSIKFTASGQITIRSFLRHGATNGAASQAALILEVVDTGCGIPVEDQQRVFERFYTVNRSRGGADRGTGLGLAIVKHALTAMGASIQLESRIDQGTTVRCIFPASTLPIPATA